MSLYAHTPSYSNANYDLPQCGGESQVYSGCRSFDLLVSLWDPCSRAYWTPLESLVVAPEAVKRFQVRNMADASSQRDLRDASVYTTFTLPKLYMKMIYCVSCAIHGRIVRVRNKVLRASPEGRIYVRPNFGGKGDGKGKGK